MARDHREYSQSAFKPLVEAAGKPSILKDLKTLPVAESQQAELFARFKNLQLDTETAFPFPDGGFLALGSENTRRTAYLATASLNDEEQQAFLQSTQTDLRLIPTTCDEAEFLILAHELASFMSLSMTYRSTTGAENFIDIIDSSYAGHEIQDIQKCYMKVFAFEIDGDNELYDASTTTIALKLLTPAKKLRSPIIDDETFEALSSLEGKAGCLDSNILQALTASQWRHVFLETYRCLESFLYFPWIYRFRKEISASTPIEQLRDISRKEMRWLWKEKDSIAELTELLASDPLETLEKKFDIFKGISEENGASRGAYGRTIYSIRNQLVHANEREPEYKGQLNNDRIREATHYVAICLSEFDKKFGHLVQNQSITT